MLLKQDGKVPHRGNLDPIKTTSGKRAHSNWYEDVEGPLPSEGGFVELFTWAEHRKSLHIYFLF